MARLATNSLNGSKQLTQQPQPIFAWAGGKRRIAKYILPLPEHHLLVDVFCGALGFFLNRPQSKAEVINDINGNVINFFRCVRHHRPELFRELEFALNSRQEFNDYRQQAGLTDIQRAARWFLVMKCSFAGSGRSWGVQRKSGGGAASSLNRKRGLMELLEHRLDSVVIENLDWRRCVELYDDAGTLFFFDPPYTDCGRGSKRTCDRFAR